MQTTACQTWTLFRIYFIFAYYRSPVNIMYFLWGLLISVQQILYALQVSNCVTTSYKTSIECCLKPSQPDDFKIIIHQFCHAPPAQKVGNSHYTTSSPFECISDSEIFCKSSRLVAKYRTYLAIPPQPMRGIFPCPKQEMQMRLQRNLHKKAFQR